MTEHLFLALGEFMYRRGHRDIGMKPVAVERLTSATGGEWTIRCNGVATPREGIPPYAFAVDWNGFPAGLVDPTGWGLAAGSVANEDQLRADLKEEP